MTPPNDESAGPDSVETVSTPESPAVQEGEHLDEVLGREMATPEPEPAPADEAGEEEAAGESVEDEFDELVGDDTEEEAAGGQPDSEDADDDVEAEADEAEEADTDEETGDEEDEFATVEVDLPEPLKDQGLDGLEFDVPAEQAEVVGNVLRALTNDYEGRSTREEKEHALLEEERQLRAELQDFREFVEREPFSVIETVFGSEEDPQTVDRIFLHWLNQGEERFERFTELVSTVQQDERELNRVLREAELDIRDRMIRHKEISEARETATERATQLRNRMQSVLERVDPEHRTFVQQNLERDIKDEMRRSRQDRGSDFIEPDVVDQLARPYLDRFAVVEEAGGAESEELESEAAKKAAEAQEKFQQRVRLRRRTQKSKTPSSGTPKQKPKGPEKGAHLDDILEDMKAGRRAAG